MFWKKDIQEFFAILETPEFAEYKEAIYWESWKYKELRAFSSNGTKKWFSQVVQLLPDTHRVNLQNYLEDIGSELAKKKHKKEVESVVRRGTGDFFKFNVERLKRQFELHRVYKENIELVQELERPFHNSNKIFFGTEIPESKPMSFESFTNAYQICDSGKLRHNANYKHLAYKHYKWYQREESKYKAGSVVYFKSNPLIYRQKNSYVVNEFLNEEVKRQRGIEYYTSFSECELRRPVIVLGVPDIPPIDDTDGGRLYKVLPDGATRPFIMPERCFRKSRPKSRKKEND